MYAGSTTHGRSSKSLDSLHRFDNVPLLGRGKSLEHVRDRGVLSCLDRVEDATALGAQAEMSLTAI